MKDGEKAGLLITLLMLASVMGTACGSGGGGITLTETGFDVATEPGDTGNLAVGSESTNMILSSNQSSITFPTGMDDSGNATLTRRFFLGETGVTNAHMAVVLQWAYDNKRFSASAGDPNGLDSTLVKHGGQHLLDLDHAMCRINYADGEFTVESGYENHPVCTISWYGAVMFCNWLTEIRDRNTDNVVYTGIDTDWVHDETGADESKSGYRLPTSDEWEYAARYLGTTVPSTGGNLDSEYVALNHNDDGTVSLTSGYYWTPGDYASGATTYYNDVTGAPDYAGRLANDLVAVYFCYWDGDSCENTGITELAAVKTKNANALGLYDISGNLWEWCYTESSSLRVIRGASWGDNYLYLPIGHVDRTNPHDLNEYIGFRFARTVD